MTHQPDTDLVIGPIDTPKQFNQLGILVIDGSGSMGEQAVGNITKAQATNNATRELFTRFKASRVAPNFTFGVVTFDTNADERLTPTGVGQGLDDNGDYDPLNGHGGGTRIYLALEKAQAMADSFLASAPAGGVPHSVVFLLMTDGCCESPARTQAAAQQIKSGPNGSRIRICAALFGTLGKQDVAGETLLKSIVSDPVLGYKTCYDGESLRNFFERSISAASGVQIG